MTAQEHPGKRHIGFTAPGLCCTQSISWGLKGAQNNAVWLRFLQLHKVWPALCAVQAVSWLGSLGMPELYFRVHK